MFEHAEQASSRGVLEGGGGATGLLNKGGGSNRLPALVTKQQAVTGTASPYNYRECYHTL